MLDAMLAATVGGRALGRRATRAAGALRRDHLRRADRQADARHRAGGAGQRLHPLRPRAGAAGARRCGGWCCATAMVPVVTFVGTELAGLVGTTALIEYVFAWGGLGQFGLNAIIQGDFAVVQGYVLMLALFSVLVFLVVDMLVLLLEPRARAGHERRACARRRAGAVAARAHRRARRSGLSRRSPTLAVGAAIILFFAVLAVFAHLDRAGEPGRVATRRACCSRRATRLLVRHRRQRHGRAQPRHPRRAAMPSASRCPVGGGRPAPRRAGRACGPAGRRLGGRDRDARLRRAAGLPLHHPGAGRRRGGRAVAAERRAGASACWTRRSIARVVRAEVLALRAAPSSRPRSRPAIRPGASCSVTSCPTRCAARWRRPRCARPGRCASARRSPSSASASSRRRPNGAR